MNAAPAAVLEKSTLSYDNERLYSPPGVAAKAFCNNPGSVFGIRLHASTQMDRTEAHRPSSSLVASVEGRVAVNRALSVLAVAGTRTDLEALLGRPR